MIKKFQTYLIIILAIIHISPVWVIAGSTFSGQRLEQACIEYLTDILPADSQVELSTRIYNQTFREDGVTARIVHDDADLGRIINLTVEFVYNNEVIDKINIPARVKVFMPAIVASKNLQNGSIVDGNDIELKRVDVTNVNPEDIPSKSEIIGATLKRHIRQGSVILKSDLAPNIMIHRGDDVRISIYSGTVMITTSGTALKDGAIGDFIRVRRDGSSSTLEGRIAEDGSVVIVNGNILGAKK